MALSLAQLTAPMTPAQMRAQVLSGLQGLGVVIKTGTGTGALALSGVPTGTYAAQVRIAAGGEPGGAATYELSLDDGATFAAAVAMPTTPTASGVGVLFSFSPGPVGAGVSFVAGDLFTFALSVVTFPVTSWQPGAVPLALADVDAQELADLTSLVAQIALGGFATTQPGITGASGSWLDLVAWAVYGLIRQPAVATIGTVTLTDTGNAGPFTIAVGDLWIGDTPSLATSTPYRYSNSTGGTLPLGGTLSLTVLAEVPGSAYNRPAHNLTTLLTSLPGVTVDNPTSWVTTQGADVESDLALATRCQAQWSGLGKGATSATYDGWARTASAEVTRTKVQAGAASTAISGSNASTTNILVASSAGIPAGSMVLASVDGSYRMVTNIPDATHVTVTPAFGSAPTSGTLSVANGGQVDVYLAGAAGAVSAGAVTAVQAYIAPRLPLGSTQNTQAATNLAATIAGTVNVYTAQHAVAVAAISTNLTNLILATPVGGTLYLSAVIEAVNTPSGVRNSSSITINASAADLVLTAAQVATLTNSLTIVDV